MSAPLTVTFTVDPGLARALKKIRAPQINVARKKFLRAAALRVITNAQTKQIRPGGRGPALSNKLTSRTGELRRSLSSKRGIDESNLPNSIEFGSDLVYAAVHEFGLGPFPKRAFFEPAIKAEERKFPDLFVKIIKREAGLK